MPRKYEGFVESAPIERRGKMPPHTLSKYVSITCPHCKAVFAEIVEESVPSNKASFCLRHLRACETFKSNGGSVPAKKAISTEFEELKAKVEEQGATIKKQGGIIQDLQDKTGLYDTVLMSVMPSLALPLTAPVESAQLSLREAAMKDLQPHPLTLLPPSEMVSISTHTQIIEERNTTIDEKNTIIKQKDTMLEWYKRQTDAKDCELAQTMQDKKQAEYEKNEACKKMIEAEREKNEACLKMNLLASRADRIQRERDALKANYDEWSVKRQRKPSEILQSRMEEAYQSG